MWAIKNVDFFPGIEPTSNFDGSDAKTFQETRISSPRPALPAQSGEGKTDSMLREGSSQSSCPRYPKHISLRRQSDERFGSVQSAGIRKGAFSPSTPINKAMLHRNIIMKHGFSIITQ